MDIINTTTLRNNLAEAISEAAKKNYLLMAKRGKIISSLVGIAFC